MPSKFDASKKQKSNYKVPDYTKNKFTNIHILNGINRCDFDAI